MSDDYTPQPPEPVDLAYLSDRAQVYVAGLEAKLRQRRETIDKLRAELADPGRIDRAVNERVKHAYRDGWEACATHVMRAADSLTPAAIKHAALDAYARSYTLAVRTPPTTDEEGPR